MKKLSIIALIISIVALLLVVWIWTDGFGSAGTLTARPTVTSTSSVTTSPVTTTTQSTSTKLVMAPELKQTMTLTSTSGETVSRWILVPIVTLVEGNKYDLVGMKATEIEHLAPAATFLSTVDAAKKAAVLTTASDFSKYVVSLDSALDTGINMVAAQAAYRGAVQNVLNSERIRFYAVVTDTAVQISYPIVIDTDTVFKGITVVSKDAAADAYRRMRARWLSPFTERP